MLDLIVACVGKPSAGKSSFLNAVSDASAKIGNYPFTTIDPNYGVGFYPTECPCRRFGKESTCKPRYGKCIDGKRYVPIKILDVAGLVPDAHLGRGLGNQFLDDLRHAHVLIHIVDASGTTNEKGEATSGYDPINDIRWLRHEIHQWIYNNLANRWDSIRRRHLATQQTSAETLQLQLSGYGSTLSLVNRCLNALPFKEPLEAWDKETQLHTVVDTFLDVRFPTVVALNKIDMNESARHIERICQQYASQPIVLVSAAAEILLRKLDQQRYLIYHPGTDRVDTLDDNEENASLTATEQEKRALLRPLDDRNRQRVNKVRDLVLFRYGSTGVEDALKAAVDQLRRTPVYPVRQLSALNAPNPFPECLLVPEGTTVRQVATWLSPDLDRHYAYTETVGHRQLADDEPVTINTNILSIRTHATADHDTLS